MSDVVIAAKHPIAVDVEAGKSYYWCSCGRSAAQPLCDGSHKGTGFVPTKYEATETKKVHFCACKHSAAGVTCDGTHKTL
jgi:CDGSH-type Zn-finger protein